MDSLLAKKDDAATLAALGAGAYILGDLAHEAMGHGLVCVATGGRAELLTTMNLQCSDNGRWMVAAGVLANLVMGLALLAILRWARWARLSSPSRHLFLWLAAAFNLLNIGAYLTYSGALNSGDMAYVIRGLEPAWLWRGVMVILGLLVYWLCLHLVAALLPLAAGVPLAAERTWRITVIPYLAAGVVACLAGVFNPLGWRLVVIAAAPSSFGSGLGLLAVARLAEATPRPGWVYPAPQVVGRQVRWLIAGAVMVAAFVALIGPGLKLSP